MATKAKKGPMSVADAEKKNPGGGNLIEAAARKKATHEAFVAEVCQQLGIYEHLEEVRKLPIEDKKALMLQLNFGGLSITDAAKVLDIGVTTAARWFKENPEEMQQLVRSTLTAESLKEVGPTWKRISDLRWSGNAETSRKAALDCLRVAGMAADGPGGIVVNVNAKNAQLALVPVADLELRLRDLAKLVGPTAEKIVDAELVSVKNLNGNGSPHQEPRQQEAVDGRGAGGDPGPAGGIASPESQPAD